MTGAPIDLRAAARRGVPPHILWPGIIIALIGLSVAICTLTVALATGDESFGVEPSYYTRALAWDDAQRLRRESERLGWTIAPALAVDDEGRQRLLATIRDAEGAPILGAEASAVAFHRARVSDQQNLAFTELGDGRYAAPIRVGRAGLWELRFTVKRGEDTFTRTLEHIVVR